MSDEHDIGQAAYMLDGPGAYRPTLMCSCGKACSGETWEEAGGLMDEHLADVAEDERTTKHQDARDDAEFTREDESS